MTTEATIMALILIAMFALLVWNRIPTWAVFVLALTVTMTLQLAPVTDLLQGFANKSVVTVGALFVVAAGMYSTGAISLISTRLIGTPRTLTQALAKILTPLTISSAFLSNTPLVAMMIPVIRDITQATRLAGSKLLIPLSFAAILGGTMTLIGTSSNLVIAGLVAEQIGTDLAFLFPTPIGVPTAILGVLFIIFIGSRLLPDEKQSEQTATSKRLYRAEFIVQPRLAGMTLSEAGFSDQPAYQLLTILRNQEMLTEFEKSFVLRQDDVITFEVEPNAMPGLWAKIGLKPHIYSAEMNTGRHTHSLVEAVVSSKAQALGHKVPEFPLPDSPFNAHVVAVSRDGHAPDTGLKDLYITEGDAVILEVSDAFFYENRQQVDFTLTKQLEGYHVQRTDRAIIATVITASMILLATFGVMSLLNAALLATIAMVVTGCLTLDRAWRSIEWKTLVILAGAIGLEAAVEVTGLSQVIAGFLGSIGDGNPNISLAVVFIGSILMTNVITNAAAAAFMFPIAVAIASQLGVSWVPFVAVVMISTSYAFINPAGFQTNLMVQVPGKYTFIDFAKVGLPLTIILGIAVIIITPLIYQF